MLVLEAGEHTGGRARNGLAAGTTIDEGTTFVYPAHHRVRELADRFAVELFDAGGQGRFLYHVDGTTHALELDRVGGGLATTLFGVPALQRLWRAVFALAARWITFPMPPETIVELTQAIRQLDTLAKSVPAAAPWTAKNAAELDRRSMDSWLDDTVRTRTARQFFDAFLGYFPGDTSLLFVLHFLNTWGGIGSLAAAQKTVLRFAYGAQSLPQALADSLGDRVLVDTPVTRIEHDGTTVVVGSREQHFRARRVIVALSPFGCRDIEFLPALPSHRQTMQCAWQPVHGVKINAVYDEPFWRADGKSGAALTDLPLASGTLDASPSDGTAGVLASYATSEATESSNADPTTRRGAVLDMYGELFGPRALQPRAYTEKHWRDEPYNFGCEGGLARAALTTTRTMLKTPIGRVYWAGVETADAWMGFLEGAVQAGQRAAGEVTAAATD